MVEVHRQIHSPKQEMSEEKPNDKTFVRITNKHIYTKLEKVHETVIKQNGKITLNRVFLGLLWVLVIALITKGFL